MRKGKLGAILLALVLIIGLVCCVVCLEKIPAGYVGVVYNMNGGVDGEVLEQGWHLVAPTKKVTKYSIGIERIKQEVRMILGFQELQFRL